MEQRPIPPPPPRGGRGSSTYCANLSEIAARIVVPIIGVDVAVVLRPIVVGRCNVVAGRAVVVHGTVETTVDLLGRDGGEIGDVGLSINHRIHA